MRDRRPEAQPARAQRLYVHGAFASFAERLSKASDGLTQARVVDGGVAPRRLNERVRWHHLPGAREHALENRRLRVGQGNLPSAPKQPAPRWMELEGPETVDDAAGHDRGDYRGLCA